MKLKSQVFVHTYPSQPFNKESTLMLAQNDMSEFGYALIGSTWIEIDVDPSDVTSCQIKQLKQQIYKEKVAAEARIAGLEIQINNLLSLENGS